MNHDNDHTPYIMGAMILALCLALAVLLNAGCGSQPLVETKVITVPVKVRCAEKAPPPRLDGFVAKQCGDQVCLSKEQALRLSKYFEDLNTWVAETWAACSPDGSDAGVK